MSCRAASSFHVFPGRTSDFLWPSAVFFFTFCGTTLVCLFQAAPGQSTRPPCRVLSLPVALFGRIRHGTRPLHLPTAHPRLTFHGAHPSGPEHHTLSPSHRLQLPAATTRIHRPPAACLSLCLSPQRISSLWANAWSKRGEKAATSPLCKGRFAANHSRLPASPNAVVVLFPTMGSSEKLLCSVSPGS